MEKLPHYQFSWIVSFQNRDIIYVRCFLWRQNYPEVNYSLNQISGVGGVFLEEMSCKHYKKKDCNKQKEHHSYKTGTWNLRTLNQGGKLENLKMEMQKNEVSILGVSEVWWKGQGEIRSGDYSVLFGR